MTKLYENKQGVWVGGWLDRNWDVHNLYQGGDKLKMGCCG